MFASVPLIPKFAPALAAVYGNFGIGTLGPVMTGPEVARHPICNGTKDTWLAGAESELYA